MTYPTTPTPPLGDPALRNLPSLGDLAETAAARWAQRKIAEQPWYRRKANTITTLGGIVATVLGYVITNAAGLPEWVVYLCSAVLLVLTVLGVNVTPNGITATTARDLQQAVHDPIVLNTIAAQLVQTVGADLALDARLPLPTPATALGQVAAAAQDIAGRHRRGD